MNYHKECSVIHIPEIPWRGDRRNSFSVLPVRVSRVKEHERAYGGSVEERLDDGASLAPAPARHQQHGVAVVAPTTEVQHVHGVRLDDEVRQVGADDAVTQVVAPRHRLP